MIHIDTEVCWKCGSFPIIEKRNVDRDDAIVLRCPNEECKNEIVIHSWESLDLSIDNWNEVTNVEPYIPNNMKNVDSCASCIHRLGCIYARTMNFLYNAVCDSFEIDKKLSKPNLKGYLESIKHI